MLDGEYKITADFKKRILETAVNQINERSDITVGYSQHKEGRTIIGFSFTFTLNEGAMNVIRDVHQSSLIVDQDELNLIQDKPVKVGKHKSGYSWNTAENAMFNSLKKKCSTLNKTWIEQQAALCQQDLSLILNQMMMDYATVDQFELDMNEA